MLPDWSLKVEGLDKVEPLTQDLVQQVVGGIDLESSQLIGSANGLICVYLLPIKTVLVWNPCTQARYFFPWDCYKLDYPNPVPVDDSDGYSDVDDDYYPDFNWDTMGFGPSAHGYKIIRINMRFNYPCS